MIIFAFVNIPEREYDQGQAKYAQYECECV